VRAKAWWEDPQMLKRSWSQEFPKQSCAHLQNKRLCPILLEMPEGNTIDLELKMHNFISHSLGTGKPKIKVPKYPVSGKSLLDMQIVTFSLCTDMAERGKVLTFLPLL
jgi:hypothetical protein